MRRIPLAGKRPLVAGWQELDPASPQWEAAARSVPRCNWGLRLEELTVVDCDTEEAVWWWLANAPETRWQTSSGDPMERRHFWYGGEYPHPGPFALPGQDGHAGDVKSGKGHQVVIPPSIHPDRGTAYVWLNGELSEQELGGMTPAPAELLDQLRGTAVSWGSGAEGWDFIEPGVRDNALTAIAGTLRRHGASEDALGRALYLLNRGLCRPPLSDRAVSRIARSVARYGPSPIGGGDQGGYEIVLEE